MIHTADILRIAPTGGAIGKTRRPRVFCGSLCDWLDDEVPIEWLADLVLLIDATRNIDWLVLTKRPENWRRRLNSVASIGFGFNDSQTYCDRYIPAREFARRWIEDSWEPPNVWFGTSVEDQQRADERIPELLKIPARVRFLSVEPLLEKIDFTYSCFNGADSLRTMPGIHWVIFGGESGRGARPCNIEWIRDGVRQCRAAGVKPFVKQMGSFSIEEQGSQRRRILWDDSKGGDPSEWPEDLRVREFPKQEQHA